MRGAPPSWCCSAARRSLPSRMSRKSERVPGTSSLTMLAAPTIPVPLLGAVKKRIASPWRSRRLQASDRIVPVVRLASTAASSGHLAGQPGHFDRVAAGRCRRAGRGSRAGSSVAAGPGRSRRGAGRSAAGRSRARPALEVLLAGLVALAVEGLRLGEHHRHPVDDLAGLLEAGEVEHHHVVDVGARDVLDRPRQQLRTAAGEGGVDLGRAVARDRDPGVARDRDQLAGAAVRLQVDEHDRRRRGTTRPARSPAAWCSGRSRRPGRCRHPRRGR